MNLKQSNDKIPERIYSTIATPPEVTPRMKETVKAPEVIPRNQNPIDNVIPPEVAPRIHSPPKNYSVPPEVTLRIHSPQNYGVPPEVTPRIHSPKIYSVPPEVSPRLESRRDPDNPPRVIPRRKPMSPKDIDSDTDKDSKYYTGSTASVLTVVDTPRTRSRVTDSSKPECGLAQPGSPGDDYDLDSLDHTESTDDFHIRPPMLTKYKAMSNLNLHTKKKKSQPSLAVYFLLLCLAIVLCSMITIVVTVHLFSNLHRMSITTDSKLASSTVTLQDDMRKLWKAIELMESHVDSSQEDVANKLRKLRKTDLQTLWQLIQAQQLRTHLKLEDLMVEITKMYNESKHLRDAVHVLGDTHQDKMAKMTTEYITNMTRQIQELRHNLQERMSKIRACPPLYTNVDGQCYYGNSEEGMSHEDAEKFCRQQSVGHVVNLATPQRQEAAVEYLRSSQFDGYYWLSVNAKSSSGRWVWSDTGEEVGWSRWQSGDPGGAEGMTCAILDSGNARWYATSCTSSWYPLCQI